MSDDKSRDDEGGKEEPQAKAGPNIVLIIAVLIVIQVILVVGVVFFLNQKFGEQTASTEKSIFPEQTAQGASNIANEVVLPVKLDVTVNIVGAEGRFLVVTLAFAYDSKDPKNKKIDIGLAQIETQLRNKALSYLSNLRLEELTQDSNIQNKVRENLLRELNATIPGNIGQLSNVYIEKWIVS